MKYTKYALFLIPLVILTAGCSKKADEPEASGQTVTGYLIEDAEKYVTLGDYHDMEVIKEIYPVSDDDVDGEIYARQQEETAWVESSDPIADGDLLTLDITWTAEGGQPQTEQDYAFELGMWEYGEDFDNQFYDHRTGDSLQFTITFEDDIWQEDWAGKTISFDILIKIVQTPEFPELTDAYAKEKGFDSMDAYKEAVREQLEKEYESTSTQIAMDSALQEAIDLSSFRDSFPKDLYDAVADAVHTAHELEAQEWDMLPQDYYDMFGLTDDMIQSEIEADVKTKLFVSALYKAENMQLTENAYQDYLSYLLTQEDYAFYENAKGLEDAYGKENMIWSAYTWYAQKFLYDQAKITEEVFDYTYEDLAVPDDPDADIGEVVFGIEDGYLESDDEEYTVQFEDSVSDSGQENAEDYDDFGDGLPVEDVENE